LAGISQMHTLLKIEEILLNTELIFSHISLYYPIKKNLEKTDKSSFYSEETRTRDHFSEKFFINITFFFL
jgi:hypothetical protein